MRRSPMRCAHPNAPPQHLARIPRPRSALTRFARVQTAREFGFLKELGLEKPSWLPDFGGKKEEAAPEPEAAPVAEDAPEGEPAPAEE